jgi:hypothetical protein
MASGCVPVPLVHAELGPFNPVAVRFVDHLSRHEVPEVLAFTIRISGTGIGAGESYSGTKSYSLRSPQILRSGDRYFPEPTAGYNGTLFVPFGYWFVGSFEEVECLAVIAPGYLSKAVSRIDLDWYPPSSAELRKSAGIELVPVQTQPWAELEQIRSLLAERKTLTVLDKAKWPILGSSYPLGLSVMHPLKIDLTPKQRRFVLDYLDQMIRTLKYGSGPSSTMAAPSAR